MKQKEKILFLLKEADKLRSDTGDYNNGKADGIEYVVSKLTKIKHF